jgi:hypothetical protein
MKKFKIIILLILASSFSRTFSQQRLSLSVYQDAKFAFIGDKKRGYEAGTLNALIRFNMEGHQQKYGYMIVSPQFEYANIKGIYKRYSASVGYTFNKLIIKDLEASIAADFGFIDRYSKSFFSSGAIGSLSYPLNDYLNVSILSQITERKDLGWLYGKTKFRYSGFIGIEVKF